MSRPTAVVARVGRLDPAMLCISSLGTSVSHPFLHDILRADAPYTENFAQDSSCATSNPGFYCGGGECKLFAGAAQRWRVKKRGRELQVVDFGGLQALLRACLRN